MSKYPYSRMFICELKYVTSHEFVSFSQVCFVFIKHSFHFCFYFTLIIDAILHLSRFEKTGNTSPWCSIVSSYGSLQRHVSWAHVVSYYRRPLSTITARRLQRPICPRNRPISTCRTCRFTRSSIRFERKRNMTIVGCIQIRHLRLELRSLRY